MKKTMLFAVLFLSIFLMNCTQTRVTSFTDPDAYGKVYNRIAIVANIDDFSERLAIENKMVETFLDNGVSAVSSISLLPPTRDFTIEQENEIFIKNNVDALAVLKIANSGFFTTSDPITVHTETRKKGKKKITDTTVSGGGTEHKAFGKIRVSLIDLKSEKTLWVGDADAQSFFDTDDPDWDMEYLLKASSKKIAKELLKTGLIGINK